MIRIEEQEKMLLAISKAMAQKATAYAIGGTAMMFYGLKDATKDIDIVFETEKEKAAFKEAALKAGYEGMDPIIVYRQKKNKPDMVKAGEARIDLFLNDVILFSFSESMRQRAKKAYQFGDNLLLKAADLHDIILLKCATDREKDMIDAVSIIKNTKIDWNIIIKEAENQMKLGKDIALLELGDFFDRINSKESIVPKDVTDRIYSLVIKQIREKKSHAAHKKA
ncbi:MAG: hypothetical protein KJ955_08345 [Nanoarchaeota archaeon]|nr:hypothetical protein [Nanoarchaeota archaeon]